MISRGDDGMMDHMATVEELARFLQSGSPALLDVRPIAAYNGWALKNERRGGHIPGASCFPMSWTGYERWPDLLKKKGITPDRSVVVYGYDAEDTYDMVEELAASGYEKVRAFERFMEWAHREDLPMDFLPRYRQLVYPEWIQSLMDGSRSPAYDGRDCVICHASFRYREDYESGHIPGAIHLDTELLESPKDWNRRSAEELRRNLSELGISKHKTVVLYGRFAHPNNEDEYPGRMAGHLAAMRCAQILLYAGVEDVRLLNGGMTAWIEAGYATSDVEGEIHSVGDFGAEIPECPELIVDTPKAKELLASEDGELVSIRSWEEFIGDVSGYNYIEKVGRIPGAIFGNCGSDAYHMENYRNVDHTMRDYHEIANVWSASGIAPQKHIAFYCGTGWRASEAFMNAYLMGWPRISVYDGGWLEWSGDSDNPVETGKPRHQRPAW